jgi:hypothetical protein
MLKKMVVKAIPRMTSENHVSCAVRARFLDWAVFFIVLRKRIDVT